MSIVAVAALALYIKGMISARRDAAQWETTVSNLHSDVETLKERLDAAEKKAMDAVSELDSFRRTSMAKEQESVRLKSSLETQRLRGAEVVQSLIDLQRTMFTEPGQIKALFSDFFLLCKPFEAVGGDFYKFIAEGDNILVACGNCGMSGSAGLIKGLQNVAMIEDIASRCSLAEIQAGDVLDALRSRYARMAERDGYRRDVDEDVPVNFTVCIVNQKERTLSYAGAYGSLCLIRKSYPGTNRREVDVHEFRGDRMNFAVSYGRRKNYTTENIVLEKDDKIYLKTDGFVNQRGGASNGRYGDQYLRQLLMKHAGEPMLEQKRVYEQEFENWRGSNRGNDILVIGLALKVAGK